MRHARYGKRRPRSSSFRLDGSLLLSSPFEVEGKGSETGQHKVERIAVEDHGGGCDPAVVERSLSFTESYRRGRGEDNDWGCSHHCDGTVQQAFVTSCIIPSSIVWCSFNSRLFRGRTTPSP
ncbi:hypothetical protein B296_00039117 [Ensete ventricosum]|uniref:Uncharacterized protein n=1 Tax=Ensete ventricosum TaxID=4639 RepID=A0A426XX03_ENSVE|nr:hypothetical protein B296_00039117 [Ensete ventricosum]